MSNIKLSSLLDNPAKEIEELCVESTQDAEKALSIYIEEHGDVALAEVLQEIHPLSLARIISEHDFSKPTLAHWLISKEKLIDICKHLPLLWYNELQSEGESLDVIKIERIQLKSIDIFLTILSSLNSDEERSKFIELVISDDASFDYILLPFVGDFLESEHISQSELAEIYESRDYNLDYFFKEGHSLHSITEGTPEHLFLLIKEYNYGAASTILQALIDDFKNINTNKSVVNLIRKLYKNAKKIGLEKAKDDDIYELL